MTHPHPIKSNPGRVPSRKIYAQIIARLAAGPAGVQELTAVCGLRYHTVQRFLHDLHSTGATHIAAWQDNPVGNRKGADGTPVSFGQFRLYGLGSGVDAARRPGRTLAQQLEQQRAERAQARAAKGKPPVSAAVSEAASAAAILSHSKRQQPQQAVRPHGAAVTTRLVTDLWGALL